MGIQINGQTDIISATDGNIDIEGITDLTLSGDLKASSFNGGPLAGSRNKIINGAMEISQRGTSFAAANGYTLDRWVFNVVGSMVCTVSQSTDVPNNTFQNSVKIDVTTADTSIAAGDFAAIQQRIEGYNVRDLIGQTFTLSFWVKSPKTGTHCVFLRNGDSLVVPDRSYIIEYTVSSANTWEYKTLTVTGGLITAGTWNWTNGAGLRVAFSLAAGSTFHTTAGSWNTGDFHATSSQVNVMDNTANDFFLTGVQLEIGSVATPFERRSYGQELALCQRYYIKSLTNEYYQFPTNSGAQIQRQKITFPVYMRDSPNVTRTRISGSAGTTVGADGSNIDGMRCSFGGSATQIIEYSWTSEAEF